MKRSPGREALSHFLAAAGIGLALTAINDFLPVLVAQQQVVPAQSVGYAALSLLIAAGTGLYSYIRTHQAQLTESVAELLGGDSEAPAAGDGQPESAEH